MAISPYAYDMNQAAMYWAPGTNDGAGGVSYAAPVQIRCRWQNKNDLFRSVDGQERVSSAVVYPDRALKVQGFLLLGTSVTDSDPRRIADAFEIKQVATSPDLDLVDELNKVWL